MALYSAAWVFKQMAKGDIKNLQWLSQVWWNKSYNHDKNIYVALD